MAKVANSKRDFASKWLILILSIASSFGGEFTFDNPAVLKDLIYDRFSKHYTEEQFEIYFSFFYSSLAIPNVIIPFIIGYLIDRVIPHPLFY